MKILELKKIDSTQKKALQLAEKGEKAWTVVLAKEQEFGIGRKSDFWYSPKGGLYFSIILPEKKIEDLEILTNLAAFLISKIIFEEFGEKPFIKFPNDVYLRGKKIAGILTQNVICGRKKISVLGIGLNTNIKNFPANLKEKATSLLLKFKKEVDNKKFLKRIIGDLKKALREIS